MSPHPGAPAEQLTIQAALTGSGRTAAKTLAVHPLVDSVRLADVLLSQEP